MFINFSIFELQVQELSIENVVYCLVKNSKYQLDIFDYHHVCFWQLCILVHAILGVVMMTHDVFDDLTWFICVRL